MTLTVTPREGTQALENLRSNLRLLKRIRGLSDREIGEGAGIGSQQVTNSLLNGDRKIAIEEAVQLACYFRVPMDVLVGPTHDLMRLLAEDETTSLFGCMAWADILRRGVRPSDIRRAVDALPIAA